MNAASTQPKRKRRVFMWVFLAIQVLFLVWIIAGAATKGGSCNGLTAHECADASDAGHGLAVAFQVVAWCVVDFLIGVSYLIYRLAKRP
jgi:hypothetical protein